MIQSRIGKILIFLAASILVQFLLYLAFPISCVLFFCFGIATAISLVLNLAWILYALHALVPSFKWQILRTMVIVIVGIGLTFPLTSLINYPVLGAFRLIDSTTDPEMVILSPAEGAQLSTDQSYEITWSSKNIPTNAKILFTIESNGFGSTPGGGSSAATANTGHYTFTPDQNFKSGQYKLVLSYDAPDKTVSPVKNHQNYLSVERKVYIANPNTNGLLMREHEGGVNSLARSIIDARNLFKQYNKAEEFCADGVLNENDHETDKVLIERILKETQPNPTTQTAAGVRCFTDGTNWAVSIVDRKGSVPESKFCIDSYIVSNEGTWSAKFTTGIADAKTLRCGQ